MGAHLKNALMVLAVVAVAYRITAIRTLVFPPVTSA